MTSFKFVLLGAVAALAGVASGASASTYDYKVTDGSGTILSGQFTTSGPVLTNLSQGLTGKTVTGLTGSLAAGTPGYSPTGPVTLFPNPTPGAASYSPSDSFIYDNLYDGSVGANLEHVGFDNDGLLFKVGGVEFNLWSNAPGQPYTLAEQQNGGPGTTESVNFSVAVPEPATWAMMLAGFGLAGAAVRSQRRRSAIAAA